MSNVSIFETRWINLVFEGRNKEYGAYQLRQENPRTTVKALLIATFLLCVLFASMKISNLFTEDVLTDKGGIIVTPLTLTDIVFPPSKKEPEKTHALPPAKKEEPKKEIDKDNLVNPTVTDKDKVKTDIATNKEAETNPNEGSKEGTGTLSSSGTGNGTTGGNENSGGDGEGETPTGPYIEGTLDVKPAFPGGIDNFYKYVSRNFKTPEMDTEKAIKVYVTFVIEKDGSMTDIRVPRNPGYGLDKEAIRVLQSLKTKWSPGKIKGKPVRTAYSLPINVQVR